MFDYDGMREIVATGLRNYLNCPVIRSNQNEEPPEYPYCSYTVTTLKSEDKSSYGEYADGIDRKPFKQIWSITVQSDDNSECVTLTSKAHEWLDHVGTVYLSDNGVNVQSVGSITNRDNVLTVEYEYRNGFDVVFALFNEVENPIAQSGYIETIDIEGTHVEKQATREEQLEEELNEAVNIIQNQTNAFSRLSKRLQGVNSNE